MKHLGQALQIAFILGSFWVAAATYGLDVAIESYILTGVLLFFIYQLMVWDTNRRF